MSTCWNYRSHGNRRQHQYREIHRCEMRHSETERRLLGSGRARIQQAHSSWSGLAGIVVITDFDGSLRQLLSLALNNSTRALDEFDMAACEIRSTSGRRVASHVWQFGGGLTLQWKFFSPCIECPLSDSTLIWWTFRLRHVGLCIWRELTAIEVKRYPLMSLTRSSLIKAMSAETSGYSLLKYGQN